MHNSIPEPVLRTATDHELRQFRSILAGQRRKRLAGKNFWERHLERFSGAWREASHGIRQSGRPVSSRHGVSLVTQFVQIFAEYVRCGTMAKNYYFFQLYLPDRWRERAKQFTSGSDFLGAQCAQSERYHAPNDLHDKVIFDAKCKSAGLPHIPVVAVFDDGHAVEGINALPTKDLITKPAGGWYGVDVNLWRYDSVSDSFSNEIADQELRPPALIQHLCELSRGTTLIVQERVRNHESMSPLTNGALSTLRIVTCRHPSGSIDFMPSVVRMPAGRCVVDNLARGGLAAPIDLTTGEICGPAIQKDPQLGIRRLDRHPDTGQPLRGTPIPMWQQALSVATRAHLAFPSIHFVGWDVAILPDGPVLVEGNPIFDTDLTVLPHGLTLSDTQYIPYYIHYWERAND